MVDQIVVLSHAGKGLQTPPLAMFAERSTAREGPLPLATSISRRLVKNTVGRTPETT